MDFAILLKQTPLMIAVWSIMTLTLLSVLVSSIALNLIFNKSYKKGVFTVKKITVLATFLSILIVQTIIDAFVPGFPGMPSFESMTTIAVGFIFGPIEGIIFGWVGDLFIVLIHGWGYQILPGLMMPTIGLIAGLMGMIYKKRGEDLSNWKTIFVFQFILLLMAILMITTSFTIVDVVGEGYEGDPWYNPDIDRLKIIAPITCSITLTLMEVIFTFMMIKKVEPKELSLLTFVLFIATFERMLELTVRPFSQVFFNENRIYLIEFYVRLLRTSYLIPSVALSSYLLIKTTSHVIEYN